MMEVAFGGYEQKPQAAGCVPAAWGFGLCTAWGDGHVVAGRVMVSLSLLPYYIM